MHLYCLSILYSVILYLLLKKHAKKFLPTNLRKFQRLRLKCHAIIFFMDGWNKIRDYSYRLHLYIGTWCSALFITEFSLSWQSHLKTEALLKNNRGLQGFQFLGLSMFCFTIVSQKTLVFSLRLTFKSEKSWCFFFYSAFMVYSWSNPFVENMYILQDKQVGKTHYSMPNTGKFIH